MVSLKNVTPAHMVGESERNNAMKKLKAFKGWSIYEATGEEDRQSFGGCQFAAYLPGESPRELFSPEWCGESVSELLDFIRSY